MHEVFNNELNFIKSKKYRDNLIIVLDLLPHYFYHIAASSTGKYHPKFTLGEGGLVRHTKAAALIMNEMFNDDSITGGFKIEEKDLMMFSIIIHDGLKCGIKQEKYTRIDHPILIANFIKDNQDKLSLNDNEILFIQSCVKSHMGPWNKDFKGNEVLDVPVNKYQKFVHMCDYIASRKFLNIEFE